MEVFFRKEAVTENTKPNAIFIRYTDTVLYGEEIVEIDYCGETWLVKESEALNIGQAMIKLAQKLHAETEAAKLTLTKDDPEAKITQDRLASRLAISVSTLASRLAIIKTFLPKTQ